MSTNTRLERLRQCMQIDAGNRGLARVPGKNLFTACPDDFASACHSLAKHPAPVLAVVTGFWIPAARLGETDGPLGAVYLTRTLPLLGVQVVLASDPFCLPALRAGLAEAGVDAPLVELPGLPASGQRLRNHPEETSPPCPPLRNGEGGKEQSEYRGTPISLHSGSPSPLRRERGEGERRVLGEVSSSTSQVTHVLALERVGPSHTPDSIRAQGEDLERFLAEVPAQHHGRCHTMRGIDITDQMCAVADLFDSPAPGVVTLGIGDGGNEIGMGKIAWETIRQNIPGGANIACRVAVDHLLVAGVSNWGAYALAAGVAVCRGITPPESWFDADLELRILDRMVREGPLVDGVSGQALARVDGLEFAAYIQPLRRMGEIARERAGDTA